MTATLEKPRTIVDRVDKVHVALPAQKALPPLTMETIELDDLVIVADVVW